MREHRFTSAFKGNHRSPLGVPPFRQSQRKTVRRQCSAPHSHNARQFVDSVAPQIDIQRNLQRALLANADRFTPPKTDYPIPLPFFFVLKIMLVYARVWPETQAVAQKSGRGPGCPGGVPGTGC